MLKRGIIKPLILIYCFVIGLYLWIYIGKLKSSYQKRQGRAMSSFVYTINESIKISTNEAKAVEVHVQNIINNLQNPLSCESSQKVVCDLPPTGFGSQVHLLTICFTIGFMTKRTVILQTSGSKYIKTGWDELFQPLSLNCTTLRNETVRQVLSLYKTENIPVIKAVYETFYFDLERSLPDDIANVIARFHQDPQLWWAGQMASYILRPTEHLQNLMTEKKGMLGFKNVIVGLQIRRTDKLAEAFYYNLTEYMKPAEKWFDEYEKKSGKIHEKRRIFIATDEPKVVIEARRMFPKYNFINDINVTTAANKRGTRYMYSSLVGIILDTFLLSMCDYIVCTMTSNVCRLAFELMQPRHIDASTLAKSLDCEYFIQKLYKRHCRLRPTQLSAVEKMIKNVF